jgi:hypothetical protein
MHFGGMGGGAHFAAIGAGPRFAGSRFGGVAGGPRFVGGRFAGARFAHAAFTPGFSRFNRFGFHHRFFHNRFRRFAFFGGGPFFFADYGYYGDYDGCWRRAWTAYGPQWVNVCADYGYY